MSDYEAPQGRAGITKIALGLVAVSVSLLPRDQRDRYSEEFRSELVGLSAVSQMRYGINLIRASWPLRRGLLAQPAECSGDSQRSGIGFLIPLASATVVLAVSFTAVSLAAREARPEDALWSVTKVIYSEHAVSVESAVVVRIDLDSAQEKLKDGRVAEAREALDKAGANLPNVSVDDGQGDLSSKHAELLDQLETPTP